MKKINILLLLIVAIATFGFMSINSKTITDKDELNSNKLTILKGAEKPGYSESNQNW